MGKSCDAHFTHVRRQSIAQPRRDAAWMGRGGRGRSKRRPVIFGLPAVPHNAVRDGNQRALHPTEPRLGLSLNVDCSTFDVPSHIPCRRARVYSALSNPQRHAGRRCKSSVRDVELMESRKESVPGTRVSAPVARAKPRLTSAAKHALPTA